MRQNRNERVPLPWTSMAACSAALDELGPRVVVEASLRAAEALEPSLNAWIHLHRAAASAAAEELESQANSRRGPLFGLPISIKDNIAERGFVCSAGSRVYGDFVPEHDATVVRRLRAAGAVILGRSNMHELADGVTSENPHYGAVHNPWRLGFHPGGSSGGSAVSLSSGTVVGSLGGDTGGSVRIPASLCGIVGLKPSRGLVPTDGVVPLTPTLDHLGPMARSVHDTSLLLSVIARHPTPQSSSDGLEAAPPRLEIGVLDASSAICDASVWELFERSLVLMRGLGWSTRAVGLEGFMSGLGLLSAIFARLA